LPAVSTDRERTMRSKSANSGALSKPSLSSSTLATISTTSPALIPSCSKATVRASFESMNSSAFVSAV
jgi:hypothetical protein